jgi:hypothetical protein
MCPSAPGPIARREEAERPPGRREYESFDSQETTIIAVPAGGVAVDVFTFSGLPDSIELTTGGGSHAYRLRNPGEPPTGEALIPANTPVQTRTGYRTIMVRDLSGAGGQNLSITGRYGSRNIDRRVSRRGPLASDVRTRDQAPPEQIAPR